MTYIFEFLTADGDNDYRLVNADSYQSALDTFRFGVPDFKLILHVYKELY